MAYQCHASLRIIAHEHVPNVYDTLWATSGSGVGFAVCSRGSSCWYEFSHYERLSSVGGVRPWWRTAIQDVVCSGAPSAVGYQWQCILIVTFSSFNCFSLNSTISVWQQRWNALNIARQCLNFEVLSLEHHQALLFDQANNLRFWAPLISGYRPEVWENDFYNFYSGRGVFFQTSRNR